MANRFWNILFRREESPIYRAACSQLSQAEADIKDLSGKVDLSTEKMTKIYTDDPKSPRILRVTEIPETLIIHYPKNSSLYIHSDNRDKYCTVLKGELFLLEGREQIKIHKKIKIESGKKMVPFTKDKDCIVFVEFEKNTFWDNVC